MPLAGIFCKPRYEQPEKERLEFLDSPFVVRFNAANGGEADGRSENAPRGDEVPYRELS